MHCRALAAKTPLFVGRIMPQMELCSPGYAQAADTTDLLAYLDKAREKTAAFLKLYSNSSINSTLRGGGYCAYSTSARCDSYDDSADVKAAMDKVPSCFPQAIYRFVEDSMYNAAC